MTTLSVASLIDRPAREALRRADAGVFSLLAPALLGLGLVSASTVAGLALGRRFEWVEPLLRAMAEGLVLGAPVLIVVTIALLPRLSPATTASALAVSIGVAGLASSCLLPLLAFLQLSIAKLPGHSLTTDLPSVMVPAFFLIAVSVVLHRTLATFDASAAAKLSWLFGTLSFSVFVLRLPLMVRS